MSAVNIPAGIWSADPAHSNVGFTVTHMGILTVHGSFRDFDATLTAENGTSAQIVASVNVDSVSTGTPQRDSHLRSSEFFDVAQFPHMHFASTDVQAAADDTLRITGELTLHGLTRSLVLSGQIGGFETDPWGSRRMGMRLVGSLSRTAYGLQFDQILASGNRMLADTVGLVLDISAVRQA